MGAKTAQAADDHLIYDTRSGALYYDPDGEGGSAAAQFAILNDGPDVGFRDFVVVA